MERTPSSASPRSNDLKPLLALLCGGKNPQPLDPIDLGPLVAAPNPSALADGASATYWDFKSTSPTRNPTALAAAPADGDLRAKVILPPMSAQVASGKATLPMLVWVNGAYQPVLDTTFLSELALLAAASGYAIACLYVVTATGAERDSDVPVKRKMSIIDAFIRLTEGADILLRQGPKSLKLRRQGRAVVGGWSRGAEAAIRACATGPAGGKLPAALRPKAFIAIAPSAFSDKDPNKSFTLDEVSGIAVFSYSDTDTELEMVPWLGRAATRAKALVTLTFDCIDHNAYLANGYLLPSNSFEPNNLAWGKSSPPPCFLPSSRESPPPEIPDPDSPSTQNPRRRELFRSWGTLARALLGSQSDEPQAWNDVLRRGLGNFDTESAQRCDVTIRAGRSIAPTTRRLLIDGNAVPTTSDVPGFVASSQISKLTTGPFSKPGFSTTALLPNPRRTYPDEPKFLRFFDDQSHCAAFRADPGKNYVVELRFGAVPLRAVNFDVMSVTPFLLSALDPTSLASPTDLLSAPSEGEISGSNYVLCIECTSASGEVVTYSSNLMASGPVFNFKNTQNVSSYNDTAIVADTICIPLTLGRNGPKSWVKIRIGVRTLSSSCFVISELRGLC